MRPRLKRQRPPSAVDDWLREHGGPRIFRGGDSGLPYALSEFLKERGYGIVRPAGRRRHYTVTFPAGGKRNMTTDEFMIFVDEKRAEAGLPPIRTKP